MKPVHPPTLEKILQMVSIVSMSVQGASAAVQLVPHVQPLLARLEQELGISHSTSKNLWWTGQMDRLAKQFFNSSWLPRQDSGFEGLNLTGKWSWFPSGTGYEVYIRQFVTWLDVMFSYNNIPVAYAQGLLNPAQTPFVVSIGGHELNRTPFTPFSMWAWLYTSGSLSIRGEMQRVGQSGYQEQVPFALTKGL